MMTRGVFLRMPDIILLRIHYRRSLLSSLDSMDQAPTTTSLLIRFISFSQTIYTYSAVTDVVVLINSEWPREKHSRKQTNEVMEINTRLTCFE